MFGPEYLEIICGCLLKLVNYLSAFCGFPFLSSLWPLVADTDSGFFNIFAFILAVIIFFVCNISFDIDFFKAQE